MKKILVLLVLALMTLGASAEESTGQKIKDVVKKGEDSAGRGIEKGEAVVGGGIKKGGAFVGKHIEKAGNWVGKKLEKGGVKQEKDSK